MPQSFLNRHLGPRKKEVKAMLNKLGFSSLNELISAVIPKNILSNSNFKKLSARSEVQIINQLKLYASENILYKTYIGAGYYNTIVPAVIKRNILENPGWYTQYTPYQAEISQGRLEALLNFQTMISDLTGLPIANASLLDEGTAAAESMVMFYNQFKDPQKNTFLVSKSCHPQTIDVLKTRAEPLNIKISVSRHETFIFDDSVFGVIVQYPDTSGAICDFTSLCNKAHDSKSFVCIATDLLALTLLKSPGEIGADCAVGNSQRFGIPMGYGGPHAAFFSTTNQFKRKIPGRIIGVSEDVHGNYALRMALQTREQHIRREKATSNICTAQVLLAIMASMYAVYHGPKGLKKIANKINNFTNILSTSLEESGYKILNKKYFDTIIFKPKKNWNLKADKLKFNFREFDNGEIGISLDETTTEKDIEDILYIFDAKINKKSTISIPKKLIRTSKYLTHPTFKKYHSETELLRYIHRLELKDLSLNTSMIPLGSCTMKLNATTEMEPITWPEYSNIHPFVPYKQTKGYNKLILELGDWLKTFTGFNDISMQPNSGAQGEYTGLLTIREFHKSNNNNNRNVCLIPASAHGTNPASAIMAGMKVVVVKCDKYGNISKEDLTNKAKKHADNLSAVMITYPSTHGVFEPTIKEICDTVHSFGGQVYLDGANLNAMLCLCKPGDFGVDVMHINLHKTFCIPHGGGGPGMGPIVCKTHLAPFLPSHSYIKTGGDLPISAVSSAPFGSSNILPISWAYIAMMGFDGLKKATQISILNANYMAKKLEKHYPILYRGVGGFNAHEFIIDLREFKKTANITDEDIAKRLMDYGYHAPTMSFPVSGTLMIEPTESESKEELDRFCDAMISIKKEILSIEKGDIDKKNNMLKNSPHTAQHVISDNWNYPYTREEAAYPSKWTKIFKFWPSVGRLNNAFGDRNLICTCPPLDSYE